MRPALDQTWHLKRVLRRRRESSSSFTTATLTCCCCKSPTSSLISTRCAATLPIQAVPAAQQAGRAPAFAMLLKLRVGAHLVSVTHFDTTLT